MGRRNVLALVAVVCALGALVGAALQLTTDRTTSMGENVVISGNSRIDAINSPTILRNPKDSSNAVVTYRFDRPGFSALLQHSQDGGETWQKTELALPQGVGLCASGQGRPCPFGPDIAFDRDGKLHVAYVALEGNGNVPMSLWLATSDDGGKTLSAPRQLAGKLTFQVRMVAAPDGALHLTWMQGSDVGLLKLVGPAPIVTISSTDGGRTFSQPKVISDSERDRVGAASPVVDDEGNLTVLYQDYKGDRRDFENLEGPVFEDPFALVITRSTDGGRTFTKGVELESGVIPTRRFLVFLPEFPAIASGPGASLYVTWADGRNGDEDVFLKRSPDGGRTWSEAVRVNDNPEKDGTNQYMPRVAVTDDGRVDVLFYDRRRDPRNVMTDAELAISSDDGRTFTNRRVSTVAFDSRVGPVVSVLHGTDFGTRLGLDSWANNALAAWTDTREHSLDDGAQDIALTRVKLPADVPLLGRWPVILGLFLLGGAALLAALFQRPPTVASEEAAA